MEDNKGGCLSEYIAKIKQKVTELSLRHRAFLKTDPLIAFRGESNDYGDTKLTPSLFRDNSYVAKEAHLFELFCDYSIVDSRASNIEKAIETQHYASISRMLDISLGFLVHQEKDERKLSLARDECVFHEVKILNIPVFFVSTSVFPNHFSV